MKQLIAFYWCWFSSCIVDTSSPKNIKCSAVLKTHLYRTRYYYVIAFACKPKVKNYAETDGRVCPKLPPRSSPPDNMIPCHTHESQKFAILSLYIFKPFILTLVYHIRKQLFSLPFKMYYKFPTESQ